MKILITGSRDFDEPDKIKEVINSFSSDTIIIHGAASGADTLADKYGKEKGLEIMPFPADWKKYGRAAGPIRNKQMLVEGKPDIVYAFYRDKAESKGTKNMVNQAIKAGIKVIEYESNNKG